MKAQTLGISFITIKKEHEIIFPLPFYAYFI